MTQPLVFLAVDLGASSGRVLAGEFDGARFTLRDLHRFQNGPVQIQETLYWDVLGQWQSILCGMQKGAQTYSDGIQSIGVDTWGVDYGLLDAQDSLVGNPVHYRDARTHGIFESAFQKVSRETIFQETGLQFMELNSLFQLVAMQQASSPQLEMAKSLLFMPDLFHWMMTGEKANELTIASTSQMYNPTTNAWSETIIEGFELPLEIFGNLVPSGTVLGALTPRVANETRLRDVNVVLPGSHDTASAVLAVPAKASSGDCPNWCYISSGTWSLMGVELPSPNISPECAEFNFTNEAGVEGTTRLLKNIAGLWLVQECRRIWKQEGNDYSWDSLVALAENAPKLASIFPPDDASLLAPEHMPNAISNLCRKVGSAIPESHGAMIRAILESLALRYREVLHHLETLIGSKLEVIHVVGGGSQNHLLCQMTADATGRVVLAGPVEATALGNVAMQAISAGAIQSVANAREIIRASFEILEFLPRDIEPWDEAFSKFRTIR